MRRNLSVSRKPGRGFFKSSLKPRKLKNYRNFFNVSSNYIGLDRISLKTNTFWYHVDEEDIGTQDRGKGCKNVFFLVQDTQASFKTKISTFHWYHVQIFTFYHKSMADCLLCKHNAWKRPLRVITCLVTKQWCPLNNTSFYLTLIIIILGFRGSSKTTGRITR